MQPQIEEVCKKPLKQKHAPKYIKFCQQCAQSNANPGEMIFCMICYPKIKKKHQLHLKGCPLTDQKNFIRKYKYFSEWLNSRQTLILGRHINHNFIKLILDDSQHIHDLIHNKEVKQFLISSKFWRIEEDREDIEASIKLFMPTKKKDTSSQLDIDFQISIDWNEFDRAQQNSLSLIESKVSDQLKVIEEHEEIISLSIQAFSAYTQEECNQILRRINKCHHKKYQKILTMLKLRIYSLMGNIGQLERSLNQLCKMDSAFKQSSMYHYYKAQKHWKKINPPSIDEINKQRQLYFIDPKSDNYYQLQGAQEYINKLSQAIIIYPQNSAFHAARGLGYLCVGKNVQAIKDFQIALRSTGYSSTQSNLNYAKIKTNTINETDFMIGIQEKQRRFIISAIKYFKRIKNHENVIKCCELLLKHQPDALTIKIQLIKGLLKIGKIDKAQRQIKSLNDENTQTKQQLKRQELYARGRQSYNSKYYPRASNHYKQLIAERQSPTSVYNLAVSLYNNERYDEAMQEIDKALKLKDCKKFRKLKLYLSMCLRDFKVAKELIGQFREKQFDKLGEFLREKI